MVRTRSHYLDVSLQDTANETASIASFNETLASTSTGPDVAEMLTSQPTRSGQHRRRRILWTNEMNEFLVRCYFLLTKINTLNVPYGTELHRKVIEKFPELRNKTIQNVLDQRRSIFINNRLPPEVIDGIRNEVSVELEIENINDNQQTLIQEEGNNVDVNIDKDIEEIVNSQSIIADEHQRKRTSWTLEMKKFMLRCYYTITKLGTVKIPYGAELHRQVTEKFPELADKTIQNILDQRRSIFINNRLSAEIINQVRQEVSLEIGMSSNDEVEVEEQINPFLDELIVLPVQESRFHLEFENNFLKYHGVVPSKKPHLKKLIYQKGTSDIINEVNGIIETKIKNSTTLEELHSLIYTGACTVLILNDQNIDTVEMEFDSRNKTPCWEKRLTWKIENLRREIGILTQSLKDNASARVKRDAEVIVSCYVSPENSNVVEILDLLKQKLAAYAKRLKRYKISNTRRQQNKQFARNQKLFYRGLSDTNPGQQIQLPTKDKISDYWSGIWSTPVQHRNAKWLTDERRKVSNVRTMINWRIDSKDVKRAIQKAMNWKSPGPDKIQNFWLKKFTSTHLQLAKCFQLLLEQPTELPEFMTEGNTFLIPKSNVSAEDPSKYRPITCLPTLYKMFTSIISEKIYAHLENNNLLEEEQKGCRKGSRGCKEQLLIDSVVMKNVVKAKENLYMAYIDYQKAFDSVPHSWLVEILRLYRIEEHHINFLSYAMTKWKTSLLMKTPTESIDAGKISIKRGIFQGDALSPLWFCLALKPLTTLLNSLNKGCNLLQPVVQISHLWYMDDLKLYARKKNHLRDLLNCVGRYSRDIQMKFGLEKCKISCIEKGQWVEHRGFEVEGGQGLVIGMESNDYYKYLGYLQARGIEHNIAKESAKDQYFSRLRSLLKTRLSARNMSKAINSFATSVLTYGFGIINWTDTELEAIDIKTRVEARKFRIHHPRSAIERFHLPRREGGRGIPSAYCRHYTQVNNLREYFLQKSKESRLHNAIAQMDNFTPLKLANDEFNPSTRILSIPQQKERWKNKSLHGKYPLTIGSENFDTSASQAWLYTGNLFAETEGFIAAIQDQVIPTRSYRKKILKENLSDIKCRVCADKEETIDHLMAGCSVLAPKQYLERHNRVAKILHQLLRQKHLSYSENVPYYEYEAPSVCEDENSRLYWNRQIITDKTIPNNIPDIILTLKKDKVTYIIDIAVPLAKNTARNYSEKVNKYLPLSDEIKSMWKMDKVLIVPIVIGATGEIPQKLHKSINTLDLYQKLYLKMQKSVLLDTAAIIRRVLN